MIQTILEICIVATILLLFCVMAGVMCYDIITIMEQPPEGISQGTWDMLGEMYVRNERDMLAYKKVARNKAKEYRRYAR